MTDPQIKRVWEGMLSAEVRANYFADLSQRYYRNQRYATWASLVFSSGAAVSVLATVPNNYTWVRAALALCAAVLSGYSVVMQNQKYAVDSADLHARWSRLAMEYEKIWENVYSDDALDRLDRSDDKAVDLSKSATGLKYDEKTLLKWEKHVVTERGFVLA